MTEAFFTWPRWIAVVSSLAGAGWPRPLAAAPSSSVTIEIEDEEDEPEDVAPPSEPSPTPPPPVEPETLPVEPEATSSSTVTAAHERELADLRARIEALERAAATASTRPPEPAEPEPRPVPRDRDPADETQHVGFDALVAPEDYGIRIGGFLQVQYEWSQLSEDELQQGGRPLNRNRFLVRRGRLRASGDWKYFAFELEVDGSTTRGLFFGVRQANASVLWRHKDPNRLPYLSVTAGLTEIPFGYEVRLGQRDLLFMERSLGSLAFFPGPVDVGLRARGALGPFRYDLAIMNGSPLDDRTADGPAGRDPTAKPDYAGRLGFDARPKILRVSGGASFLSGTGFHAGQDATKNVLQWQDLNENGSLDTGETIAIPGTAATPSQTFRRWAVGVDLQLAVRSRAGWSSLFGEASLASSLDRGFMVADPIVTGSDVRHLQGYVAFTQELFAWALFGLRYDHYNPYVDWLDRRRGNFVPREGAIHTFSPIVGAMLPARLSPGLRTRLVVQYDFVLDHLGRDPRGVPTNLKNDQLVVRLQGAF